MKKIFKYLIISLSIVLVGGIIWGRLHHRHTLTGESEVFIIGGGEIFAQALGLAERMYLTEVHATTEADVFFPEFEADRWIEIESEEFETDAMNDHPTTFKILNRKGDDLASGVS